jgi:flagellar FliL protein
MAEENEQMEVQPPANKVASAKNPLLTILVILNTVVLGAVGYFQYMSHQKLANTPSIRDVVKAEMKKSAGGGDEAALEETGQAQVEDGKLFPLDGFTANLAQGDGPRRFLRLNTVLKFSESSNEEEFKRRKAQIRDSIITTLNGKRPEDLLTVQGKNFLKEEIKASINSFLVDGHVIDVFLVSFQIN